MNKKTVVLTIIAFILSCLVLVIGTNPYSLYAKLVGINAFSNSPRQLYKVYLAGETLGIIDSKQELEDYIDSKQKQLKDKYQVDKVYAPNDLKIMKEITYDEKISTVEEIYKKIEEIKGTSSFTIDGYKIDIEGLEKKYDDGEIIDNEDLTLYVIDRSIFENSVKTTITAFINPETYEEYLTDTQKELSEDETGTVIEKIRIDNEITITKCRIPAEAKIYTSEEELSKFLLFGTTEEQETYVVQAGDTIEEIANDNKLSVEEFLIANTKFKSASDLLYPGQEVKLGLITPQFDLVETRHVVSEQTISKETVYKNDDTQYVGYEKVEESGKDGLSLVTQKMEVVNGEIIETKGISTKVLVPAINKVIVRGTKRYQASIGTEVEVPVGIGSWVWPTNTPYTISSGFGWRWGKLHNGIDITGPGYNSPIKAANNGIVVQSGYTDYNGNYITIAHSNGYYTYYGHLAKRYKQVGDVVMASDVIGTMGQTGFATGVHLHFGLYRGYPYRGGVAVTPYTFYR